MSEEEQNESLRPNDEGGKSLLVEDIDRRNIVQNDSNVELTQKKKRSVKGKKNGGVNKVSQDRVHLESVGVGEENNSGCVDEEMSEIKKKGETHESSVLSGDEGDNSKSRRRGIIGLRNSSMVNYEEELEGDESDVEPSKSTRTSKRRNTRKIGGKLKKGKGKRGISKTEDVKNDDSDFEVEKITHIRYLNDGKREFLIRWKGFSAKDDTWEPEENLDCKDLIREYFKKNEKESRDEDSYDEESEKKLSRLRKKSENSRGTRKSSRVAGNRNDEESQSSDTSGKRSQERASRSSSRVSRGSAFVVNLGSDDEKDEEESNDEEEDTKSRSSRGRKVQTNNKRKTEDEPESSGKNKRNKKDQDKENVDDTRVPSVKTDEFNDSGMEDAAEYEVQKILDVRHTKNGSREFFIKWKGFSSIHNSWEPEKHLNCSDKLKQFLKGMEKLGEIPMRELRFHRKKTDRLTLESPRTRKLSTRIQRQPRKSYIEVD